MYASEYDRDFAMAVGDAFNPEEITPWQLAEMCERCGLQKRAVAKALTTLSGNLLKSIAEIDLSMLHTREETGFAAELSENIRKNVQRYQSVAEKLPRVVL
jgi:serine/threonine-protein kinase HipA